MDHSWLWRLSKHRGPILTDEEFVEALRLRLGCAGPTDPVDCGICGKELLDSAGSHAMCCAKAESTHGHYEVTKQVLAAVHQHDPGAETEVPGLIPGTALRPADILTIDVGGGTVALDIGIISRRRGCLDAAAVHMGLHRAISVKIWRRAARQVMSCWPRDSGWWLEYGDGNA